MKILGRHQSKLSVHTNDDWALFDPEENGSILGKTQRDKVLKVFEPNNSLEETYHDHASNEDPKESMYYLGQPRPQIIMNETQPTQKQNTTSAEEPNASSSSQIVYSLFATPSIPEDDDTAPLNLSTSSLVRTSTGRNNDHQHHHISTEESLDMNSNIIHDNNNKNHLTELLQINQRTNRTAMNKSPYRESNKTSDRQFYSVPHKITEPEENQTHKQHPDNHDPELELAHQRSEQSQETDQPEGRSSALQFLISYQSGLEGNYSKSVDDLSNHPQQHDEQQTLVSSLSTIQDSQFKDDDEELDQEAIRRLLLEDESVSKAPEHKNTHRTMTPTEEVANKMRLGPASGDNDKDDDDSSSHTFHEVQQSPFRKRNVPSPSSLMLRRNWTSSPSVMRRNAPSPSMSLASHTIKTKKSGAACIFAAMTGKNRRHKKAASSVASSSVKPTPSEASLRKLVFPKRLFQKRSTTTNEEQPIKRLAASPLTLANNKNKNTSNRGTDDDHEDHQEREQLWKQKLKQRMAAKEEERLSAAIPRDSRKSAPKRNATPTTFVFEDNLPSGKRTIKSISPMNQGDDMSSLTSPPERMEEQIQRFIAQEPGILEEEKERAKPQKKHVEREKPTEEAQPPTLKDAWTTAFAATLNALVNVAEKIEGKVDDASSAAYTASTQSSNSQNSTSQSHHSGLSACFVCTSMARRCSSPEEDDDDDDEGTNSLSYYS